MRPKRVSGRRGAWLQPCRRRPGQSGAIQWVIGKSGLDVNLWQVDNALWSARYRNPYLLLTAGQYSGTIYCEYDILNAAASVHRL